MKLIKYLFALVVVATISVNLFTNKNLNQYNTIEMMNVQALAHGEDGSWVCVDPPRVLCKFIDKGGVIIPLYGILHDY